MVHDIFGADLVSSLVLLATAEGECVALAEEEPPSDGSPALTPLYQLCLL